MKQAVEPDIPRLIEAVKAGDIDAYADIVRHYQWELWRIVVSALRDHAEAEDLVQQAFLKAYLNLDRYDPKQDFGTWLRTICRNTMRNELRRSMRANHKLRRYYEHLLTCIEDDEQADGYEQRLRQALAACKEELSPAAARALRLRYDEGREFAEIAGVLDRTVAACRQLLTRVRLELRKCMHRRLRGYIPQRAAE